MLAKLPRIAAAAACVATSVFFAAPKPAEACFFSMIQIDDCNWVSDYVCSYHNDGTGGYYLARSSIVTIC
ncbi:MAG TPA: hypothetical protein VK665_15325 [Candidatus Elarobacter sp.]|nr:hypothetical protein [Candidatus Elarobacter sp.]